MKDWFFYQDKGKTVGPVTEDDLRERIREGRIRLFDLIHKEGDAGWRMAMEYPLLKEAFNGGAGALKERPWVCLQRKNPEDLDFKTTGPFSNEEVRESLLAGRISYNDYAWRTGFAEWKRIGSLEDFNPRLKNQESASVPPVLERTPSLKNVVELRRPRLPEPEAKPPDAAGEDLVPNSFVPPTPPMPPSAPAPEAEPPRAVSTQPEKSKKSAGKSKTDSDSERRRSRRRRKTVPWFDWGIVFALVLVLGVVAFVLSRSIRSTQRPTAAAMNENSPPPAQPIRLDPLPAPSVGTNDLPAPEVEESVVIPPRPFKLEEDEKEPPAVAPARTVQPSKKPTDLFLAVSTSGGNRARIQVRSNGSTDIPIYIQVVGLPGQVSEGASFYRFMRMKPSAPGQPLDLSSLKLPQGKFILRVASGDLTKETRFSLGLSEASYKQSVSRLRKQFAHAVWSERLQLFKLTLLLEKRASEAMGGKKFVVKGLEPVLKVKRSNGQNYVLFEDWFELKDILDEARSQPTAAVMARIKKANDRMASFSVWR